MQMMIAKKHIRMNKAPNHHIRVEEVKLFVFLLQFLYPLLSFCVLSFPETTLVQRYVILLVERAVPATIATSKY